ncbi:MAG: hypothetical protein SGCHY_001555, partial [Lobulomycetales sp.]
MRGSWVLLLLGCLAVSLLSILFLQALLPTHVPRGPSDAPSDRIQTPKLDSPDPDIRHVQIGPKNRAKLPSRPGSCIDSIPQAAINDDYCDCEDGSDEP